MPQTHDAARHRHYLAAGILASLLAGVGKGLLVGMGLDGDISTLVIMLPMVVALFALFREPFGASAISAVMLATGLLGGLLYYWTYYLGKPIHIDSPNGVWGAALYLANGAVIIPLFEEMVVRRLLFFGLSVHMKTWLAAIVVSVLFGLTHQGSVVFTFFFSILMCVLAARQVGTVNRALLHGGFNLALSGMWLWVGYYSDA